MEIKGKILEISETQEVKDNFRKREFILEYSENDKYIEYLKFEAIQDKCEILDSFAPGSEVEVFFNLRGRPWVDKTGKKSYFNSLQAWRLKPADESTGQSSGRSAGSSTSSFSTASSNTSGNRLYNDQSASLSTQDPGSIKPIEPTEKAAAFQPSDEDDLPF